MPTIDEVNARVNQYPAALLAAWQDTGRHFGSGATRAQVDRTANAHTRHRNEVEQFGFDNEQFELLVWCGEAIDAVMRGRWVVQVEGKVTNKAKQAAKKPAKAERFALRSILESRAQKLRQAGGEENDRLALQIESALTTTVTAGEDGPKLAGQVELLATTLEAVGGAAERVAAARAVAARVRAAESKAAVAPGTPAETQLLDILDGMVVELVRLARRAARASARASGNAALEKAYELAELYA